MSEASGRSSPWRRHPLLAAGALLVVLLIAALVVLIDEAQTSGLQARYFSGIAENVRYRMEAGANASVRFPGSGPYDQRLGYSEMPAFLGRLQAKGYGIEAQARATPQLGELMDKGYFPPYPEKNQAGLSITDCSGEILFKSSHPARIYASFDAVPPVVLNTLLFIENRELLETEYPRRNPAVEWGRLSKAVVERGIKVFDPDYDAPGGSTLATQIEKYRHSPGGITTSIGEKFRQMMSASIRAYMLGEDTSERRRQVAVDYLNTVPLAAASGYGEVNGIGDGLWAWYGADFHSVNALLSSETAVGADLDGQGLAYREVLSLLIAQRRPSYFLVTGRSHLFDLTDSYLRVMADVGIVTPRLRDAALKARTSFREDSGAQIGISVRSWKGANAIRTRLLSLLEAPRLYDVDRLDLTVSSTLDTELTTTLTGMLQSFSDPAVAKASHLRESRLLAAGDPSALTYSFALYERGSGKNLVRVQTDSSNQPFDINEGAKLELGSTAKLRTLATYLAVIESLHERYAALGQKELRAVEIGRKDRLTRWAIDYLSSGGDASLQGMLDAAMERRYSANPSEEFFTGGGLHKFSNFKREENGRMPSVREAIRDSVNLPFIRVMRDIVDHYMYRAPESPARVLDDARHPGRAGYLRKFADHEGKEFVRRFYRKYRGMAPDEALDTLLEGVRPTPLRLAVIFRTLEPTANVEAMANFLRERLPASRLGGKEPASLYERYGPDRYSLGDRGYLARVHPLELWVVAYLRRHPDAGITQTIEAGAAERLDVYGWLYKTHQRNAQDVRIRTLLEMEAFQEIHRHWKRLAYPFEALVPSYATAIGVSGDRPAALADLIGIILNDGVRQPTVRLEDLHFAAGTPYETRVTRLPEATERVMPPEIAATLKKALTSVVEDGTARRLRGAFSRPGRPPLLVGGKTGTGDNRFEVYGADGSLRESRAVNRTATFAFFLGERHYGVITAYVPGAIADNYSFTSALPVQILKNMAPQIAPYLTPDGEARCGAPRPSMALSHELTIKK
jgi:membrane peptidoglycan carboxypeptidase